MFKKVLEVIPLASQTFSKSYLQYIKGQAPLFADKAKGSYIWDVDGNRYVDMVNSLLPVVIGYQDKAVDAAIKSQLKKGIIFSLRLFQLLRLLLFFLLCFRILRC